MDTIDSPIDGFDAVLKSTATPATNVDAIEAYRKVVDSFGNQASREVTLKIVEDMGKR